MREVLLVAKRYPLRSFILIFVLTMQVRAYFTRKFIWPFSHQTVMYSAPTEFPFERLYLEDAETKEIIETDSLVQRPSKLTFLYLKWNTADRTYQKYLEALAFNKDLLKNKKVLMKREMIHQFRPLCESVHEDVQTVACLDRGQPCL